MNILLLTSVPPAPSPFVGGEKRLPLGLGFLISVLRKAGHRPFFIETRFTTGAPVDLAYLKQNKIDAVGVQLSTPTYRNALDTLSHLQRLRQQGDWRGLLLVGGAHPTVLPDTLPDYVDYVIQGEGETALLDALDGKTGRVVRHPRIKDLDSLPRPAYDAFANLPYRLVAPCLEVVPVFPLNSSRGCPFNCAFCSVLPIWGREYTTFSPERIIDDIRYLKAEFGASAIFFQEDNFTVNRRRVEHFCELALRESHPPMWSCESRVDSVDRELLQLMRRAGCRSMFVGAESGSQRVLDLLSKGITVEQIRRVREWCRELGIAVQATFMFGTPGETVEDRVETVAFIDSLKLERAPIDVYRGIPGSQTYQQSMANGDFGFVDEAGIGYTRIYNFLVDELLGGREESHVAAPSGGQNEPAGEGFSPAFKASPGFRKKLSLYRRFSGRQAFYMGNRRRASRYFLSAAWWHPLEIQIWKELLNAVLPDPLFKVCRGGLRAFKRIVTPAA
jgi:radical SAM superfamily enzyme YgiQ (UPF0313 family)